MKLTGFSLICKKPSKPSFCWAHYSKKFILLIWLDLFLGRKKHRYFRKKTAKGVDNPNYVCHSLTSSLNVFEKRFSPL